MEYEEKTERIEVPRGTGIKGFLRAIETIMKLPRLQGFNCDVRGILTYTRFVAPDEPGMSLSIDFESLMPWASVRNGIVEELVLDSSIRPLNAITEMFLAVSRERLAPVAFVAGANPTLFDWLKQHHVVLENKDELMGLPLLRDRQLEDYVLILAAGYVRGGYVSDAQKSFKIVMPERKNNALDRTGSGTGGDPPGGDAGGVQAMGHAGGGLNGAGSAKP